MRVWVDSQRCRGHTLCAMIAPHSFSLDDIDGTSSAVDDVVPDGEQARVREAARSCPEQAILIEINDDCIGLRADMDELTERPT